GHGLLGPDVPRNAARPRLPLERPEAREYDLLAPGHRAHHRDDEGVHHPRHLPRREPGAGGDLLDQLALVHGLVLRRVLTEGSIPTARRLARAARGTLRLVAASGDQPKVDLYGATYGHFAEEIYAEIRREASGEDVGQNSWVTTEELDRFARDLALGPGARLLDVACGSGGPTLHLVRTTECTALGVDMHDDAIETAGRLAAEEGLADRAMFQPADAAAPLPFADGSFDAILCIDAINHLANRPSVLREWTRLVRPGGRLGFTDPITVTGILARHELAIRASAG